MPEALAVFLVLVVCVGVYLTGWWQARDPANRDPVAELTGLRAQQAWLTERLQRAEQESWGSDMQADLARQLSEVSRALALREGRNPEAPGQTRRTATG